MEAKQLEFAVGQGQTGAGLRTVLQDGTRRTIHLAITRNRVSMVSICLSGVGVRVRLHHAFLSAPADVISALTRYVRRPRRADWRIIAAFARTIQPDAAPSKPEPLRTKGAVYDLDIIRRRVTARFFSRGVRCRVGWGKRGTRRRRPRSRHIRYGSYVRSGKLVRINPILDDARVPEQFVEYIVFHEMLHAVVPSEQGSRWSHHTRTFRQFEDRFPDAKKMRRLCSELVPLLTA